MAKRPTAQSTNPELPPELEDLTPPTEPIEIELAGDDNGSTEVELAPAKPATEPEPVVEKNPLQEALDAQKRAEELQFTAQRERDDALRQTRERDNELTRERSDREDAQYNAVLTAIAAEQSSLDKAQADYTSAAHAGDWDMAGKAQRFMASAASRLDRLEEGKQAFETRREEVKTAPARQPASNAPLDFDGRLKAMPVPDSAKSWLRNHPEFVTDTELNEKIGAAHNFLTRVKSVQAYSPAYFEALDEQFGFKEKAAEPEPQQQQPQRRSMPVSAPVSRDVPTASGVRQTRPSMTLTAEERNIARTSFTATDMTDAQKEYLYAQNKQKLQKMRANGEYRQTTEQNG